MSAIRAVIFDLDGTLVDSAHVVGAILNAMRFERALPPLPLDHFRRNISRGAAELVSGSVGNGYGDRDVTEFRRRYAMSRTERAHLYAEVAETLETLAASGLMLAVCSNKPEALCRKVLDDTGLQHRFGAIVGGDTTSAAKPDPRPLHYALNVLGVGPEAALLVGDSTVDELCARAAGVPFVFFAGGYDDGVNHEACKHVTTIGELAMLLQQPIDLHRTQLAVGV